MDLLLPGMNGFDLTRRLKHDPALSDVPIIALTASAMKGDEQRALEAGCDGYIAKPLDTRVRRAGSERMYGMVSRTSKKAASLVLVVDDEQEIRQVARRVLEHEGYLVIEASGGAEAIQMLSLGIPLDLLMVDLEMPGLRGDEMVRRIRSAQLDVKVLYVTGHIDVLMDARPLWDGEAFLDKPFSAVSLREAAALLLCGSLKRNA